MSNKDVIRVYRGQPRGARPVGRWFTRGMSEAMNYALAANRWEVLFVDLSREEAQRFEDPEQPSSSGRSAIYILPPHVSDRAQVLVEGEGSPFATDAKTVWHSRPDPLSATPSA